MGVLPIRQNRMEKRSKGLFCEQTCGSTLIRSGLGKCVLEDPGGVFRVVLELKWL